MKPRPPGWPVPAEEAGLWRDDRTSGRASRLTLARAIAQRIAAEEGGLVFSVQGRWGSGKTAFLSRLEKHLRVEGHHVSLVNAWREEYLGSPTLPLYRSLLSIDQSEKDARDALERLRRPLNSRFLASLARVPAAAATYWATAAEPLSVGLTAAATKIVEGFKETVLTCVDEGLADPIGEALSKEVRRLAAQAAALAPVEGVRSRAVVLIDELDRCRPTYAINLLETMHHFFEVDNLVFVLGINRRELARAVEGVYGEKFSGDDYLRRFFTCTRNISLAYKDFAQHRFESVCEADDPRNMGELVGWAAEHFGLEAREQDEARELGASAIQVAGASRDVHLVAAAALGNPAAVLRLRAQPETALLELCGPAGSKHEEFEEWEWHRKYLYRTLAIAVGASKEGWLSSKARLEIEDARRHSRSHELSARGLDFILDHLR